jgi:uncharacterized membrane protein YfcA
MHSLFSDYSALTLIVFGLLAFLAGFIDSVAGGGGLIQLPALLIGFPKIPVPTLIGTNKIAGLAGTSVAAWQYSRHVKFNFKLLLTISFFTFISSYAGAKVVGFINPAVLKPLILAILVLIGIYTFLKKDLGSIQTKTLTESKKIIFGSLLGLIIGFYDGFFGPGTGSFLVLGFVVVLGFDFVSASAYSKIINCIANISALTVFIRQGNYLLGIAIILAIGNITGSIIGSRIAIKKGNRFIRFFFLIVVAILIARYGYDVFLNTNLSQ